MRCSFKVYSLNLKLIVGLHYHVVKVTVFIALLYRPRAALIPRSRDFCTLLLQCVGFLLSSRSLFLGPILAHTHAHTHIDVVNFI